MALNNERSKWMRRLKKCLAEMPTGTELIVVDEAVGSDVYLVESGTMAMVQGTEDHDILGLDFSEYALASIRCSKLRATSETN